MTAVCHVQPCDNSVGVLTVSGSAMCVQALASAMGCWWSLQNLDDVELSTVTGTALNKVITWFMGYITFDFGAVYTWSLSASRCHQLLPFLLCNISYFDFGAVHMVLVSFSLPSIATIPSLQY